MGGYKRRTLAAGVIALLGGALCPVPASADTDVGSAGGFTYIEDFTSLPMGASSAVAQAECPPGTKVVGGGAGVGANGDEPVVRLTSSFPFDGPDADERPDDGWEGRAVNLAGASKVITVTAICGGGQVRYESNPERVPAGVGGGPARCPDSMHASGGGVSVGGTDTDHWLNRSRPFDGGDDNAAPDDGWQSRIYNDGSERRVTTFAICVNENRRYRDAFTDSGAFVFAYCPPGSHGTGGGLSISGAPIEAHATYIDPFAGSVNPPDTGFAAVFSEDFGPPKTLTSFAVCAN